MSLLRKIFAAIYDVLDMIAHVVGCVLVAIVLVWLLICAVQFFRGLIGGPRG